jgi:hypothetical protein
MVPLILRFSTTGFWNNFCPKNPNKSCIVLDRATYHRVPEEPLTPAKMRYASIQSWYSSHKIAWESYWLKPILVFLLAEHLDRTPKVSKTASKHEHKVLFLPVHHPELNPIEFLLRVR